METRTIIDKIEIEPQTGNVGVRMRKQVLADNGEVLSDGYHRTMIDAGGDPDTQIAAVNAHLAAMGFPAIKTEDVAVLNSAMAPLSTLRATKAQEALAKGAK